MIHELQTKNAIKTFRACGVSVAYLFGSHAKGTAFSLSDIDVAVLLDDKVETNKRFDIVVELTTELMKLLETNDIDVIALNDAPPLLRYNVFANGKIIFSDSERDRVQFEVKTMRDYFDTKRLREIFFKAYVDRSA